MRTYYYAVKNDGDHLFDNFPEELTYLISEFKPSRKPFQVVLEGAAKQARMGVKHCSFGTIYTLTTESKFVNRYKLFQELVEMSTIGLKPLINFQKDLTQAHTSVNEEFIHNVTSLNSYSIQDLFSLIPQNTLTENITKQNDIVREIIAQKPNVTVKTLLNLIKYTLATKVEFSVFERTLKPTILVQKTEFQIRAVILSILQIFIDDFDDKRIDIHLDACEKRLAIDYDSIFVSLYYILDNAIKYCCKNTKFKIIFKEEKDCFSVAIIMISIRIEDYEVQRLTTKGYRSESAKKLNESGHGIGMYRILKTLKLNNAELEITPRINSFNRIQDGITYEGNQFKIKFKNQQDWLR